MSYCLNCGKQLPEGANFCPACGMRQEQHPRVKAKNTTTPLESKKKIKMITGIVTVVTIAVVTIVCVAFFVAGNRQKQPTEKRTDIVKEENNQSAEPVKKDYSYESLIGEESPISGYWQSDTAGMYIGYNVSSGDEGFAVYLQSQEFGFRLLHGYNYYECSGGDGYVQFTYASQPESKLNEQVRITVVDDDTITLNAGDMKSQDNSDTLKSQEYTFKRAELDKKTLSRYAGNWIDGGRIFDSWGDYGTKLDLEYCKSCGAIHPKDYRETAEGNDYHKNIFVSLYDGMTLHYIFPYKGLYNDEVAATSYWGDSYTIKENELDYETYIYGGGGGENYVYFREGSEQAQSAEVVNAYENYLDSKDYTSDGAVYNFLYIDNDDIPELLYDNSGDGRSTMLFSYYNGKVYENITWCRGCNFSYIPRKNQFQYGGSYLGDGTGSIAHLEKGEMKEDYTYSAVLEESGNWMYTLNDTVYTEEEFNGIWNSCFDSEQAEDGWGDYSTLREAFEDLGVTEYGYSLYHIEDMSFNNGILYIKDDSGEEIRYSVAEDCIWDYDSPFDDDFHPISYEELESDWKEDRSYYTEDGEVLDDGVRVRVKDDQIIRVYTEHP